MSNSQNPKPKGKGLVDSQWADPQNGFLAGFDNPRQAPEPPAPKSSAPKGLGNPPGGSKHPKPSAPKDPRSAPEGSQPKPKNSAPKNRPVPGPPGPPPEPPNSNAWVPPGPSTKPRSPASVPAPSNPNPSTSNGPSNSRYSGNEYFWVNRGYTPEYLESQVADTERHWADLTTRRSSWNWTPAKAAERELARKKAEEKKKAG